MRLALILLLAAGIASAADPTPAIRVEEIAAPVSAEAAGASLTRSPDGVAWLSWLERNGKTTALRCATFDGALNRWNTPRTIASGENWFVNWADFPAITVGANGHATAVWFVNNPATSAAAAHDHHDPGYRALISRTVDHGRSWSQPAPLTRESDSVEFVSLATLADGRVLAVWLDGRAKKSGAPRAAQQLFSRILGSAAADTRVDASVCDCCQTALTAFPDGTALVAYRGRSEDEIRDVWVARFRGDTWSEPRPLNNDDWKIAGCTVNGPQLASDGGRVAVSWFTAAENNPRVLTSFSPDAGTRFLMPLKLNHVKPAGRVATQLLHDGAILVTWVDADGAGWLHRVTPDFTPTDPVPLAAAQGGRTKGFPRTVLLRDYTGGKSEAQLLVAFTRETSPMLRTLLVRIPEGDLLEAEKSCDCAPEPAQLRGFPVRGTIAELLPESGAVRATLPEVPGLFAAGVREFRAEPAAFSALETGRAFLARAERRDGAWWLFAVRVIQ